MKNTTRLAAPVAASQFERTKAKGNKTYMTPLSDGTSLTFFLHGKPGCWKTTELTTGRWLTRGHTIAETLADTAKMIVQADPMRLRAIMTELNKAPTDGYYIAKH